MPSPNSSNVPQRWHSECSINGAAVFAAAAVLRELWLDFHDVERACPSEHVQHELCGFPILTSCPAFETGGLRAGIAPIEHKQQIRPRRGMFSVFH